MKTIAEHSVAGDAGAFLRQVRVTCGWQPISKHSDRLIDTSRRIATDQFGTGVDSLSKRILLVILSFHTYRRGRAESVVLAPFC